MRVWHQFAWVRTTALAVSLPLLAIPGIGCRSTSGRLMSAIPAQSAGANESEINAVSKRAIVPAAPSESGNRLERKLSPSQPDSLATMADEETDEVQELQSGRVAPSNAPRVEAIATVEEGDASNASTDSESVVTTSATVDVPPAPAADGETPPLVPRMDGGLTLSEVIDSVYQSFPMVQAALYQRNVAAGEQIAAEGAFDLKLKGIAANQPVGYYQTYRNSVGLEQPTYWGGQFFGGYRNGNGYFEPWYLERQTNEGGEFKGGVTIPLAQNRAIDERRAELWKSMYGRSSVEPFIQSQLIEFTFAASVAYWEWVGAGQNARYAEQLLELAKNRNEQIGRQVEAGQKPESDLTDNERLIVSRQVKLIETRGKLQSAAVKLSLFLRSPTGEPRIPDISELPDEFPLALPISEEALASDIAVALQQRPELRLLAFDRRIAEVDLSQAENLTLPQLDATFTSAKDMGKPTSPKNDKGPYELEALINLDVPLQRRKARGKIASMEGKLAQIAAKTRFTQDKITIEVENARVGLMAAFDALEQARRSVELGQQMEQFEQFTFERGAGDLLRVNIRELQTFDAQVVLIDSELRYFIALAAYRAALASDVPADFEAGDLPPASDPSVP